MPGWEGQDFVGVFPANLPMSSRWSEEGEFTHCYLDQTFLTHAAHESINPDRVEIKLKLPPLTDPLIWQIGMALRSVLEHHPDNSRFYAESILISNNLVDRTISYCRGTAHYL